ncbi:MAG TPA: hypothetical protein IAD08_06540 [Candidatus Scatovivens faecipullorum]|nr:hypothetical protein [Candidatus Scatovivens faecipullorum]
MKNISLKEWDKNRFLYYYFANTVCKDKKYLSDMKLSTDTGEIYLDFAKTKNIVNENKIPYIHLTCAFREDKENDFRIEIMLRGCSVNDKQQIKINSREERDEIAGKLKDKLKLSDIRNLDFECSVFRKGKISLKLLKAEYKTENYQEMLNIIKELAKKLKNSN